MTVLIRRLLVLVAVAGIVCLPAIVAGVATTEDLAAARQALADARNAANGGPNGNRTNPYPTLKSAGC
jgi:hypothetical protein